MERCSGVVEVKPEKLEEYKQLHAAVWPEVLDVIRASHIKNYSIYLRRFTNDKYYLFSYFEYNGDDFENDMAKMAADPNTQKWWDVCKPCHTPFSDRNEGQWWAEMEEVFHLD
jgi:L-rhamnose mutarotase